MSSPLSLGLALNMFGNAIVNAGVIKRIGISTCFLAAGFRAGLRAGAFFLAATFFLGAALRTGAFFLAATFFLGATFFFVDFLTIILSSNYIILKRPCT